MCYFLHQIQELKILTIYFDLKQYQATSQCFRAYSPTQSCRPTKIIASQSRPSSQAGGTLAIPPYRPVMLNQYRPIPSISSYYRVPNSGENSLLNVRKVGNYRVITAKEDKKYDDIRDNGRPRQFVNKVETEVCVYNHAIFFLIFNRSRGNFQLSNFIKSFVI